MGAMTIIEIHIENPHSIKNHELRWGISMWTHVPSVAQVDGESYSIVRHVFPTWNVAVYDTFLL